MPFDKAKTSLGFIEEKLIRLLGLAGQINATFRPELTPVIVQDDLTNPGVSSFRGRHFAYASDLLVPGAANTSFGLRFSVACIIECMWVAGSPIDGGGAGVNTRLPVHIIGKALGDTFTAMTRRSGTWTEGKVTESDQPPLFDSAAGPTVDPAVFASLDRTNRLWVAGFAGGSILNGLMTTPPSWKGCHLLADGQLRLPTTLLGVGTSLTFGVMGRIA